MTTGDLTSSPAPDAANADLMERIREQVAEFGPELEAVQEFSFRIHRATYRTMSARLTVQQIPPPVLTSGKDCLQAYVLDVGGLGITGADGSMRFFLSAFVCHPIQKLQPPVAIVATPLANSPVFLTATTHLQLEPSGSGDLEIRVFAWDPAGSPAPSVRFSFRVIVPGFVDESDL